MIRIEQEQHGIPANRIVVGKFQEFLPQNFPKISSNFAFSGGFSMGGALALHAAYCLDRNLAGAFACSSFLNNDSVVFNTLRNRSESSHGSLPRLLMFHGDRDSLVPTEWGKRTFERLVSAGASGEFVTLKNTMHELKPKEITQLQEWIEEVLPPLESDLANKL